MATSPSRHSVAYCRPGGGFLVFALHHDTLSELVRELAKYLGRRGRLHETSWKI